VWDKVLLSTHATICIIGRIPLCSTQDSAILWILIELDSFFCSSCWLRFVHCQSVVQGWRLRLQRLTTTSDVMSHTTTENSQLQRWLRVFFFLFISFLFSAPDFKSRVSSETWDPNNPVSLETRLTKTELMWKGFESKISGNEVYYTACSLLVILKNSYSKRCCQKVSNLHAFSYKSWMVFYPVFLWDRGRWTESCWTSGHRRSSLTRLRSCLTKEKKMLSPGPWKMIRNFHSIVWNPCWLIPSATHGVTSGPP